MNRFIFFITSRVSMFSPFLCSRAICKWTAASRSRRLADVFWLSQRGDCYAFSIWKVEHDPRSVYGDTTPCNKRNPFVYSRRYNASRVTYDSIENCTGRGRRRDCLLSLYRQTNKTNVGFDRARNYNMIHRDPRWNTFNWPLLTSKLYPSPYSNKIVFIR